MVLVLNNKESDTWMDEGQFVWLFFGKHEYGHAEGEWRCGYRDGDYLVWADVRCGVDDSLKVPLSDKSFDGVTCFFCDDRGWIPGVTCVPLMNGDYEVLIIDRTGMSPVRHKVASYRGNSWIILNRSFVLYWQPARRLPSFIMDSLRGADGEDNSG